MLINCPFSRLKIDRSCWGIRCFVAMASPTLSRALARMRVRPPYEGRLATKKCVTVQCFSRGPQKCCSRAFRTYSPLMPSPAFQVPLCSFPSGCNRPLSTEMPQLPDVDEGRQALGTWTRCCVCQHFGNRFSCSSEGQCLECLDVFGSGWRCAAVPTTRWPSTKKRLSNEEGCKRWNYFLPCCGWWRLYIRCIRCLETSKDGGKVWNDTTVEINIWRA